MRRPPASERVRPAADRGVSTAVTHVLAVGITTILVSGLLVASAGLLADQEESASREELQEIGNRIAEQVYVASEGVDADSPTTDSVTVSLDQPARVAGYSYTVTLYEGDSPECDDPIGLPPNDRPDYCLVLDPASGLDVRPQVVPVDVDGTRDDYDTVSVTTEAGGEFTIDVEG